MRLRTQVFAAIVGLIVLAIIALIVRPETAPQIIDAIRDIVLAVINR